MEKWKPNRKEEHSSCCSKVELLTANYRFEVNQYDHRKTHKCKENGRHAAMLEMPERAYEDCQDKLKKATVKSYQTIMLTSPTGGAPLWQYDPKIMRARSRFE